MLLSNIQMGNFDKRYPWNLCILIVHKFLVEQRAVIHELCTLVDEIKHTRTAKLARFTLPRRLIEKSVSPTMM